MLQNPCKTLGFKKNMVYEIPPVGGGKPYPASGLIGYDTNNSRLIHSLQCQFHFASYNVEQNHL